MEMSFLEHQNQSPVDSFFSKSIDQNLRNSFNQNEYRKIRRRALIKTGRYQELNIKKLFEQLEEAYPNDYKSIIQKILDPIVSIKTENKVKWFVIHDTEIVELFLTTFGDPLKKNILDIANIKDHVSMDMLATTRAPQASGYRRIKDLISSGFLIETGVYSPDRGRKAPRYTSLIDKVQISIEEGFKTSLKIKVADIFLKDSEVVRYLL